MQRVRVHQEGGLVWIVYIYMYIYVCLIYRFAITLYSLTKSNSGSVRVGASKVTVILVAPGMITHLHDMGTQKNRSIDQPNCMYRCSRCMYTKVAD
jgi:hypothetical protein